VRDLPLLVASFLFASIVSAQRVSNNPESRPPSASSTQSAAPAAGARPGDLDAVPGREPGTRRYNVTFADRPFDLRAFRAAATGGGDAATVARIVADLDARAQAHQAPFAAAVKALGGRVERRFWLVNACTIDVPPVQLAAVRALPGVLSVAPDLVVEPAILTATNSNNHNADAVQAMGIRGDGFAMAIIDTGQDENMAGLGRPHMIYFRGGSVGDATAGGLGGSRLLINQALASQPADNSHPHGTGVCGIAAGERWNNAGADRGHACDARIVGYSICDAAGSCISTLSIEAAAWQQCAADKVKYNIVAANMSYSSSPSPTDVSQQAIDAAALNAGILPVCAAANNGASTASSSSCANGLAVANVAPDSKVVAASSSRGPLSGDPQRFFPDIAACGTGIVMPLHEDESSNWVGSGTSMASPEVCGAAVLVKNARPTATALELKAILLASTESIAAQNPGLDRNAYGMGFLRDDLAVGVAQRGDAVLSGALASTAAPDVYALSVSAGVPCTVCLAFQRQVLTSTAWSDLSLRVTDGVNLVASSDDPRNLYERVTFTPAVSGTLVVEVAASLLEIAPLPYALATTASFTGLGTASRWEIAGGGCPGVRGRPSLFPTSRPRLGGSLDVGLAYANSSSLCLFAIGFSDSTWNGSPLPFDLATLGAPGCAVRASPDSVRTTLTDADGTATLGYAIPALPAFSGAVLFQQAFGLDSSANALGIVASNAGSFTVGDF
jgi:hypothetical protein